MPGVDPREARGGAPGSGGVLGLIERAGNLLPNPILLFFVATLGVMIASALASGLGWTVRPQRPVPILERVTTPAGGVLERPALAADGRERTTLATAGDPIAPRNLLTSEGGYWLLANLVRNFMNFPPLGVVLVCMLGIGVAERVGLFNAGMRLLAGMVPGRLLTPTVVFLGIMANTTADAGFIVLPPLAATLFVAYRRSPVVGVAAAFAGLAGGFSANLVINATDTLVAPLTERGARVLDPAYTVLPTCNWWFLAASAIMLTLLAWAVTAWIVEPRFSRPDDVPPPEAAPRGSVSPGERRGLGAALLAAVVIAGIVVAAICTPGAPLHGDMPAAAPAYGPIPAVAEAGAAGGALLPRWTQAIVPIILGAFLIPGIAYGIGAGTVRRAADIADAFTHAMVSMAPVIAMAFFAAQFIECLRYSRLDQMIAFAGGGWLASLGLPPLVLLAGVVALVMCVNMLVASMSAKWAGLATVLVPMMMLAGISPELTQAAYRVGDSVTNPVTPLNPYMIIVLVCVQRYRPRAGLGDVIAMMTPYAAAFAVVWTGMLLLWVWLGLPLGPGGVLWYAPGGR